MPAIPLIGLAISAAGAVSAADSQRKALHAQQDAANAATNSATNGSVNIADVQAQAQQAAKDNAANSAALEQQYNPGVQQLRTDSLAAVDQGLARSSQTQTLADQVAAQAGKVPQGISYDSPLLRDAISKAQSQLALGGTLDTETQNAVTRHGLATAAGVGGGGLTLGRDVTARDLGLTSLQLEQTRLNNASTLGGQEAALGQGNANLSLQAQQAGTNNLFNSANFLASLDSGDFARKLAAAQLGQNIAQPASGLDPGAIANLAVGNSNATAAGLQQAAALQAAGANQKSALSGQLIGTGLGIASKYFTAAPQYTSAAPVNNSAGNSYYLGG